MPSRKEREEQKREELRWQEEKLAQLTNPTQRYLATQFSSFIQWKQGQPNSITTKINRGLLEKVIASIQKNNFTTEQQLANYWLEDWQKSIQSHSVEDVRNKYRSNHPLEAYLQRRCFYAARKLYLQYKTNPSFKDFEISDYFNIGYLQLEKVLGNYNPILNPNLAAHASLSFKDKIIDQLRRLNSRSGKSKNYLLINTTTRRLEKALNHNGISNQLVKSYIHVWEYYKEIYQETDLKKDRKYSDPDEKTLEYIVLAINKNNPPQLLKDIEQLKDWMNKCSQAIRNYNNIQVESYDRPINGENHGNYLDLLAKEKELIEDNIEQIEASEHSTQLFNDFVKQLAFELERIVAEDEKRVLKGKRRKLLDNFDAILELRYACNLNETKIAAYINYFYLQQKSKWIPQCRINRQLNRLISGRDMLGDRLLEWMKNHSEYKVRLAENAFIKEVFAASIKSVLQHYYQSLDWQRYAWLESEIAELNHSQQESIEIYYGRYIDEYAQNSINKIVIDLNVDFGTLQQESMEIKNLLVEKFISRSLSHIDSESFQADSILINKYLSDADANRSTNQKSQVTMQDIMHEIIDSLLKNYCKNVRIKTEDEIEKYRVRSPDLELIQQWLAVSIGKLKLPQKNILLAYYGDAKDIAEGSRFELNNLVTAKETLVDELIKTSEKLGINFNLYDLNLADCQNQTYKFKKLQKLKVRKYVDSLLLDLISGQKL